MYSAQERPAYRLAFKFGSGEGISLVLQQSVGPQSPSRAQGETPDHKKSPDPLERIEDFEFGGGEVLLPKVESKIAVIPALELFVPCA